MSRILRIDWLAAAAGLVFATGCVDDNGGGATLPDLDAAFVGYSNPDTKQTTCGNCHIEKQRTWTTTAHASAWADLPSSGQANSVCAPCHTTNGSSNLAPDTAGYMSVAANAKKYYYDVQCEACHGPGAGHVTAPDDAQPLTTIAADTGLAVGCGTCHSGEHNPFVSEWRSTRHGISRGFTYAARADCAPCHDGTTAVRRFDSNANYVERTSVTWTTLGCAVCHDPHGGTGNPNQLRLSISDPNLETNLCMQCHYRRSVPDPTSSRGPHAPQGPLLLGEAGWRPSTFTYDSLGASSHGTTANPRLCVTCHMQAFNVTNPATGSFVFRSTGHSFRPIPCIDAATGMPDTTNACAVSARSFRSCVTSGCHSSESVARNAFNAVEARMELYAHTLWKDVNGNGSPDAFPTDSGMVAIVKRDSPSEIAVNATITVAEGALFNAQMMLMPGNGVHNPFYGEALLIASIEEMRTRYSLPAPPAVVALMRQRAPQLGMRAIP